MRNVVSRHEDVRHCPACGGELVREARRRTIRYGRHSVDIDQPAWWCRNCGEGVLDSEDSAVADRVFAKLKANAAKGDNQSV